MENHSNNEFRKKSALTSPASSQYIEFGELQKAVSCLSAQNRKKYEEIREYRPNFHYQLYKANENKSISISFGRQLLLKQMDRLMEEENFLNREISHIAIEKEEHIEVRETLMSKEVNPFQVLKSIWNGENKRYQNSIDHADSLNHTLGHIRLSIKKIADLQRSNSPETHNQYLKTVSNLHQSSVNCQKCPSLQIEQKQLRAKISSLQQELLSLSEANKNLEVQLAIKNENIRKLNKKMLEFQTESHSRVMYLEERLLMEDHKVKLLKKFKNELEKNAFNGPNYQLFLKTQEDLTHLEKHFSVELQELLAFLIRPSEASISLNELEEKPKEQQQPEIPQDLLLELTLPLNITQHPKKANTERPKTDRKRNLAQNTIRLEQLQFVGKKYMRTNQLTSKRNRQVPTTPLDTKHTISTLQLSESPKSIEQQ